MRRLIPALLLAAAAVLAVLLLPRFLSRSSLPNVVLITLDTTRADRLGCYGYFRNTSPKLDAFAEESILFETALTPMAHTLPTHCSLLTGTYPVEHGITVNSWEEDEFFRTTDRLRSFAQFAAEGGYRTAAFVSATSVKSYTGIDAGFAVFDEPEGREREGERTADLALRWLGGIGEEPYFLWVHFFDPHKPYRPRGAFGGVFRPDEELRRFLEERAIPEDKPHPVLPDRTLAVVNNDYDGEILYMDHHFGRLIDALRERPDWERTAVIVAGDHGEGLGQHGEIAHGRSWHEQIHPPLMMRIPGEEPRRVPGIVSLVDALPTALARLEDRPPFFDSFLEQASGGDLLDEARRPGPVFSMDVIKKAENHRSTLTDGRWKYHRVTNEEEGIRHELYDLAEDPFELRSVAGGREERVRAMEDSLLRILEGQTLRGESLRAGASGEKAEVDSAILEELRALGYLD